MIEPAADPHQYHKKAENFDSFQGAPDVAGS